MYSHLSRTLSHKHLLTTNVVSPLMDTLIPTSAHYQCTLISRGHSHTNISSLPMYSHLSRTLSYQHLLTTNVLSPLMNAVEEDADANQSGKPQSGTQHARPSKVESDAFSKVVTDFPKRLEFEKLGPGVIQVFPGVTVQSQLLFLGISRGTVSLIRHVGVVPETAAHRLFMQKERVCVVLLHHHVGQTCTSHCAMRRKCTMPCNMDNGFNSSSR